MEKPYKARKSAVLMDAALRVPLKAESAEPGPTHNRPGRWLIDLMMEAVSTSETSFYIYLTIQHNDTEDSHLHTRCRENWNITGVTVLLLEGWTSNVTNMRYKPQPVNRDFQFYFVTLKITVLLLRSCHSSSIGEKLNSLWDRMESRLYFCKKNVNY
jgi:hypothetical protein